jgi:hypothetical protein
MLLLLTSPAGQAQHGPATSSSPALRLLRSTATGVVLELVVPGYEVTSETLSMGTFHRLVVSDTELTLEPGEPQVPVVSALLGAPPDAKLTLHILSDEAVPVPGRFRLLPTPRAAPLTDDLLPGRLAYEPDPAAYASDALRPATPARIADEAWLREQRIVRIELYPFQYNPVQGTLLWHRRLRVEVRFDQDRQLDRQLVAPRTERMRGNPPTSERAPLSVAMEPVLRRTLLNYETARMWRGQPLERPLRNTQYAIRNSESTERYKITTDHDALYRLTYADLQAAGMDVDAVDPRTFRLSGQGQDVAIYVAGEEDGRFDPHDFILFYGQKFRGTILAERYAEVMAPWLTLCPQCRLAGMFEKYTDENVYWLAAGDTPGPRMAVIDGTPGDTAPVPAFYRTTVHAEESREWYTHHFTSEDTWFWDRVQPGPADAIRTYTTTLTALATGSFTATVRASVVSRSSNAGHHTQFYLNGDTEPLDDAIWDGKDRYTSEALVDQSRLREGVNRLDFAILYNGAFEDMYFDWFEIEYARRFRAERDQLLFPGERSGAWQYEIDGFTHPDIQVYDVTDPFAPRRVLNPRITPANGGYRVAFEVDQDAGARYLAVAAPAVQRPKAIARYIPPDLRSSDNGADFIIITHRVFRDAVQRLADYRAAQGMRVKVIDVEDLYNEFNDGIFHPIAIRNFLAYAFSDWQPPAPSYVLLVGDGHWNLKGYGIERYGIPEPIYMPPNLAFVDPWQGEVDSANLLAAVVGDDILPDLAVGRLPVNSVAELDAVIEKIIAYEQAGPRDWQRYVLFVADNVPDPTGDFVALADNIIRNHLPRRFQADRIYLNDYCGPPTSPPQSCPVVNAAIVETLNRAGALFVNYIGHASVERWAHEQVFVNGDIPALANGDRLPVVLSMTCLDGYWIFPNRPSLAEELVRAADRGAVAAFSPTGLGVATGHHVLQRRFYDAVFQDGVRELGAATLAAKLALYASGRHYDLIHTFTIFGDPALRLQVLSPQVYLPLIRVLR